MRTRPVSLRTHAVIVESAASAVAAPEAAPRHSATAIANTTFDFMILPQ
jgi:hypothetical protein